LPCPAGPGAPGAALVRRQGTALIPRIALPRQAPRLLFLGAANDSSRPAWRWRAAAGGPLPPHAAGASGSGTGGSTGDAWHEDAPGLDADGPSTSSSGGDAAGLDGGVAGAPAWLTRLAGGAGKAAAALTLFLAAAALQARPAAAAPSAVDVGRALSGGEASTSGAAGTQQQQQQQQQQRGGSGWRRPNPLGEIAAGARGGATVEAGEVLPPPKELERIIRYAGMGWGGLLDEGGLAVGWAGLG
jgi:hypothetical protein